MSSLSPELEHLYKTAHIGLCLMDTDLRFVRINERLAAINGKPASEHIGKPLSEIVPEIAQQVEPIYRKVIEISRRASHKGGANQPHIHPNIKKCSVSENSLTFME